MAALSMQPIERKDLPLLREVARAAYLARYRHIWTDGGAAYLANTYGEATLATQLQDPLLQWRFLMRADRPLGYLCLRLHCPLAGVSDQALEIVRLYLLASAKGAGLGKFMLHYALEEARARKKDVVWLKMMAAEAALRRYYQMQGFEPVGKTRLEAPHIKPEKAGMLVLAQRLN